ncbi:MAG TPA: aldo/keto reductase [Dehalococcoidia bacterium]|nr:aldo/keto reductase [Dehalococcoidia bacterium]
MPNLPKRKLGRTDLEVSVLSYGTADLGRGRLRRRRQSEERAGRILNAVLDSGINLIDTSIDYVAAEERIGRYISHRRAEYYLATKCGCKAGWGPWWRTRIPKVRYPHVFTRENVIAGVEQSLRRLRTDYVDLVALHHPPARAELEASGVIEALVDLKQQGKVRWIGSSARLPELPGHIAMGVFDVFQVPYSALHRENEPLLTAAAQSGAGVIIRSPLVRGAPNDWLHAPAYIFSRAEVVRRWRDARLDDLLDGAGTVAFMLRFALSHPDMDTALFGTLNPEHLRANLETLAKGPLPVDVLAEAKRRLAAAGSAPATLE